MKTLRVYVCLMVLGAAVGLSRLTPSYANNQDVTPTARASAAQSADDSTEAKTFVGKVAKAKTTDGKLVYVLQESSDKSMYILDDQDKAKQFEGKDVKVKGTLDVASRTIHVLEIEENA